LEACRDVRGLRWLEDAASDLRLALRRLLRAPAFTVMALLTLAVGIGANAALFTLVDAVLLQRLPVPHPEQLVLMGSPETTGSGSGTQDGDVVALPFSQYELLRDQTHAFSGVAAFGTLRPEVRLDLGSAGTDAVPVQPVSANYFQVLGLQPERGRFFDATESGVHAAPEVILSHGFWRQKFGGSNSAIGRTVLLHGQAFTVIGVAPPGFYGTTVGASPALYIPLRLMPMISPLQTWLRDPPGITRVYWLLGLGRLRPGITLAQAQADSGVVFAQSVRAQAALAPDAATRADLMTQRLPLVPAARGASSLREHFAQPLLVLQALVALLLLIVVVNLGGLLLAQADARKGEFAMRLALGASRGRIVRQLLTEGLLLAGLGTLLGALLAQWGERLLIALVSGSDASLQLPLGVNATVLAFLCGIGLLAGVAFGLAPARQLSRPNLTGRFGRFRNFGAGSAWVVAQVAVSLVLVTSAALFVRSMAQLRAVPLGYQPAPLTAFNLNASRNGMANAAVAEIYQRVAAAARLLPGVTAVTYSENGLFAGGDSGDDLSIPGYHGDAPTRLDSVAPGFFAVLGIPLRRGREFTPGDTSRGILPAVIDEALARRYFAGRDPMGQMIVVHFTYGDESYQVVGVSAKALINSPREDPGFPRLFMDVLNLGSKSRLRGVYFTLRLAPGASVTLPQINRLVATATGLPLRVNDYARVQVLLDATLAPDQLLVSLSAFFAILGLG
ncbi:MAG: ABC transporter permease, partial [Terriglobales bacterium]